MKKDCKIVIVLKTQSKSKDKNKGSFRVELG